MIQIKLNNFVSIDSTYGKGSGKNLLRKLKNTPNTRSLKKIFFERVFSRYRILKQFLTIFFQIYPPTNRTIFHSTTQSNKPFTNLKLATSKSQLSSGFRCSIITECAFIAATVANSQLVFYSDDFFRARRFGSLIDRHYTADR